MELGKNKEENFKILLKEHFDDVVKVGGKELDKETLDRVQDPNYSANVEGKFERFMLAVMLLKSANIFNDKKKLEKVDELGGGFYNDGDGFGVMFKYDGQDYICSRSYKPDEKEDKNRILLGAKQMECFDAMNKSACNRYCMNDLQTQDDNVLIKKSGILSSIFKKTSSKEPSLEM